MAIVTSHISLSCEFAVTWSWWSAASLVINAIVIIGKYICRAVTSLVITQPSISTLVWFITNMAVVTSHISLSGDLAVTWTWWWTACLLPWAVEFRPCNFYPRAVTNFATSYLYFFISTLPRGCLRIFPWLTGKEEDKPAGASAMTWSSTYVLLVLLILMCIAT